LKTTTTIKTRKMTTSNERMMLKVVLQVWAKL